MAETNNPIVEQKLEKLFRWLADVEGMPVPSDGVLAELGAELSSSESVAESVESVAESVADMSVYPNPLQTCRSRISDRLNRIRCRHVGLTESVADMSVPYF